MSLILNIDSATETAQVSVAKDGIILQVLNNATQKDHASFLQTAIQQVIKNAGITLKNIDAISVTAGPGSYTGLRVGMASAKGLCYALNKPFITLNTLQVLTVAAQQQLNDTNQILFCPMIDARRMEVFTAIYDQQQNIIVSPAAMILEQTSFDKYFAENKICFFGNGSPKWQVMCKHPNAVFEIVLNYSSAMASLSNTYYLQQQFANLAYSEPFYIKEFQDKL